MLELYLLGVHWLLMLDKVKNDVDRARQVLLKFNTRILETRAASNVVTTTRDSGKFLVTDDWQPLGLGWVPIGKVCKEWNIEKL
ncbi:hypothetical protein LTR05_005855 [Lithohypha guttulata]|uniref:Uncharacterized protein n=1 Tax=Lithohypha guttulata TaxID=1690604 RepID=A0AAN7Y5R2_9EURO|nr:hypothetical protein LTR05_005855 [Lithohypha guttulata]